jgi:hypothetical protein
MQERATHTPARLRHATTEGGQHMTEFEARPRDLTPPAAPIQFER